MNLNILRYSFFGIAVGKEVDYKGLAKKKLHP